jgi:hypothetical protein
MNATFQITKHTRNYLQEFYGRHECKISGFLCDVDEICALLGYYAASSGNPLPTFRNNVSVPSSRVKNSSLRIRPIRCPETSVKYYHSTLHNIPEERRSRHECKFNPADNYYIFLFLFINLVSAAEGI